MSKFNSGEINEEEFSFISLLADKLTTTVEFNELIEIYYVGISDSMFIAHKLSHNMLDLMIYIGYKIKNVMIAVIL